MAGISDQAMLKPEYRFKYNGIELNHKEFSDGTGLELYTAQFRGLDPQIGRWWQVDPDIENGMEAWSPYASNYDNPIRFFDPLGNDPNEDCCGFTAALNDIKTGEKIAGVVEIAGGGPEDPVADAVAGAVEVGTFVKAGFDFFTKDDKPVVQVKAEGKQDNSGKKNVHFDLKIYTFKFLNFIQ